MSKQYGLILADKSKKAAPVFVASKNVFGDDGDSDNDDKTPIAPYETGDRLKRQARNVQEKVISEDPTVYQYDELYDDIERNKKEKYQAARKDKTPKYIATLLDAAEKRKKENERRVERQVQKEREEEGDKFIDKESFVTSAYKKKLEEMRLDEEKDKRMQYLEEICDVTKQKDLGGFYRHLYDQQLNSKEAIVEEKEIKEEKESEGEDEAEKASDSKDKESKGNKVKRSYRKRKHSSADTKDDKSDSEEEDRGANVADILANKDQRTHLQSNIDADSDFSIDDSSSDEDEEGKPKEKKKKDAPTEETVVVKEEVFKKPFDVPQIAEVKKEKEEKIQAEKPKEAKVKVDIWKKRTVGELFQQALKRYYERKGIRI